MSGARAASFAGDGEPSLDYDLPPELIAQRPADRRDGSRLMVVDRASGTIEHARFDELPSLLPPAALLVANDTKVYPARLAGHKTSGGRIEFLVLETTGPAVAAMFRVSKPPKDGARVVFEGGVEATVRGPVERGRCRLDFGGRDVAATLAELGSLPLPPYIEREPEGADAERYQTVFAADEGSVAAPTAGLHFTDALLGRLEVAGFGFERVTLHVGPGTFTPVRGSLDGHRMEAEHCRVDAATAAAIDAARAAGRPVVAVGTTTVRTLESVAARCGGLEAYEGPADAFIRPGHRWAVVDALVTNFHLPGSTLLALVMALAGESLVRRAYAEAVSERYRFYSYGDAMLIR